MRKRYRLYKKEVKLIHEKNRISMQSEAVYNSFSNKNRETCREAINEDAKIWTVGQDKTKQG